MDRFSEKPKFDNSVRGREAVRRAARRLIVEIGYTPNKQANLINAFLNINRERDLPLKELKTSTWTDFVKIGSTRVPTDIRIVQSGWLWMLEEFPEILIDEFEAGRPSDNHVFKQLIATLTSLERSSFSKAEITALTDSKIRFAYKFDDRRNIAVGQLRVQSDAGSELRFSIMLPHYNAKGNVVGQTFEGHIIPFHSFNIFMGTDGERPIIIILNVQSWSLHSGVERLSGRFLYVDTDNHFQDNEFLMFLDENTFEPPAQTLFIFSDKDYLDHGMSYALVAYHLLNGDCSFRMKFV